MSRWFLVWVALGLGACSGSGAEPTAPAQPPAPAPGPSDPVATPEEGPEPTEATKPTEATPEPTQDVPGLTAPQDDGSCKVAADCEAQNLEHIMCDGGWECEQGRCAYRCGARQPAKLLGGGGTPNPQGQRCTVRTGGPGGGPAPKQPNPCPAGQFCQCMAQAGYSCSGTCQPTQ